MLSSIKRLSVLELILALRAISIVLQIALILFVSFALDYQLPLLPLFFIITTEVIFNGVCYQLYKKQAKPASFHILFQLLADVIFLGWLLYFSGGATNAFVSLLLIPIAISAVSLTIVGMTTVALSAIVTYSLLLWAMPMHVMHGNMEGHFIGMWINFLFSSVVVIVVVGQMARAIAQRETTITKYREEQLKQERIMALGVASAQVTHDLATPLATINLLVDEIKQDGAFDQAVVDELSQQVARCNDNLHRFRDTAEQIKNNQTLDVASHDIASQLMHHCRLTYPNIDFAFDVENLSVTVNADGSLIPAIANIIDNAVEASLRNNQYKISISNRLSDVNWQLVIQDFGQGFLSEKNNGLGDFPQRSDTGLGISILLSNASLERLGGKLELTNYEQGAQVVISLPIVETAL